MRQNLRDRRRLDFVIFAACTLSDWLAANIPSCQAPACLPTLALCGNPALPYSSCPVHAGQKFDIHFFPQVLLLRRSSLQFSHGLSLITKHVTCTHPQRTLCLLSFKRLILMP